MIAVIGDLHGCFHTLKELYYQIKSKYPSIKVYCVGDLVDRGNFSYETVHFCISNNIEVCLGNHDYMFHAYFREPFSITARSWIFNGHIATLNSYKNHPEALEPHLDYIEKLKLFYNTEDAFICHAGISKVYKKWFREYKLDGKHDGFIAKLLENDLAEDFSVIWVRGEILNVGKLQIVGHTHKINVIHDKSVNICYIDTGCVYGNKLTGVIVENSEVVEIIQIPTFKEDIISF